MLPNIELVKQLRFEWFCIYSYVKIKKIKSSVTSMQTGDCLFQDSLLWFGVESFFNQADKMDYGLCPIPRMSFLCTVLAVSKLQ